MADDADLAQHNIEHAALVGLAEVRRRLAADREIEPTGQCHYCDAIVGPEQLYCDAECCTADEHERKLRRMAGVA